MSQDAHAYDLQGDMEKAEAGYRRALALDPVLEQGNMGLGRILVQQGKIADAPPFFQTVASLAANARVKAEALYSVGMLLSAGNDHTQAETFFTNAISADPTYSSAYVGLAAQQFVRALSDTALSTDARSELVNQSFDNLARAVKLNPNQTSAAVQLGIQLYAFNNVDQAMNARVARGRAPFC